MLQTTPEYQEEARELYRLNVSRLELAMKMQSTTGQWLIATLAALNGGALYALAAAPQLRGAPITAAIPFLVGILATLACGFTSWLGLAAYTDLLQEWTDSGMIHDPGRWPKEQPKIMRRYRVFVAITMVLGFNAAFCIPVGAWIILSHQNLN